MFNNAKQKVVVLALLVVGLFTSHTQRLMKLATHADKCENLICAAGGQHGGATCD